MAPYERYPSRDQRERGPFQAYQEEQRPSWITISETERPLPPVHGFEPYPRNGMSPEYDHVPVRMFDAPVGPSPEAGEPEDAPFYVPRNPPRPHLDTRDGYEVCRPGYLSQHHDDREDRCDYWPSEAPLHDSRYSYTDRNNREADNVSYNAAQRHAPRDRKPSAFPYSKNARYRDQSRDRQSPPSVSKSRKFNSTTQPSRQRPKESPKKRQPSRESSVSNTSQHRRQYSHDDTTSPFPHPISPQFTHSNEMTFSSSQISPISPVSTPSLTSRSRNGTPPNTNMEGIYIPQAIVILNHMLQRQSLDQILRNWKATGQGPNPFDYPDWEGWCQAPLPRPLSPRGIHGDMPMSGTAK